MKFLLKIESDNEDNGPDMVASNLERVAEQLRNDFRTGLLMDGNGNRVGYWEIGERPRARTKPSIKEIAALTSQLAHVSGPDATEEEKEAFLAEKKDVLDRIERGED